MTGGEAARPRRTAIVQSNYIPWKGYFDMIGSVDSFVLLDEVQFTRRDWRNRNRIKTAAGLRWLTIPVETKGRYTQRIDETRVAERSWARSHWSAIEQAYRETEHFEAIAAELGPVYASLGDVELLSAVNLALLRAVCAVLGIATPVSYSTDYETGADRSQRLLDICLATGATQYVSGPAASGYLDVGRFERAGVGVEWFDYSGYPEYPQPHGPFEHGVSVVDLLFCTGPRAAAFLVRGVAPATA